MAAARLRARCARFRKSSGRGLPRSTTSRPGLAEPRDQACRGCGPGRCARPGLAFYLRPARGQGRAGAAAIPPSAAPYRPPTTYVATLQRLQRARPHRRHRGLGKVRRMVYLQKLSIRWRPLGTLTRKAGEGPIPRLSCCFTDERSRRPASPRCRCRRRHARRRGRCFDHLSSFVLRVVSPHQDACRRQSRARAADLSLADLRVICRRARSCRPVPAR